MTRFDLLLLISVLGILLLVGVWGARKVDTEEEYLLAKRQVGLFSLTATLVMTEFNTSTLIAFSSMGYVASLWALTLPMVFLIGLLFYGVVVADKWKAFNGFSVAQFFTERYGAAVGKLASCALMAAMAGFSAVYVRSMTLLFAPLMPHLSFWMLSLLLVGGVLAMTLRGGLVAVIQTDVASFILLCLVMPVILYFAWQGGELPALNWEASIAQLPPWFVVTLTLLTMFTYILAPWYGQKIFAAKSGKVARLSVFFAAILVFCFYGMAVVATSFLQGTALDHPDQAFPTLIMRSLPSGMRGVAYALLFSAAATTLSGVWSAMTTMLIADFLGRGKAVQRGIWITLGFAFLSYILANLFIDQVFQKLILANIPVLALSFALLAGFYLPSVTSQAATSSIVVGLVWGIFSYLYFGEAGHYQWYWVIYGLPLIFLTGYAVTLFGTKKLQLGGGNFAIPSDCNQSS